MAGLMAEGADARAQDGQGYNALLLAGLGRELPVLKAILAGLSPADARAPVTLVEGGYTRTFEDAAHFFEEESGKPGQDYFAVIEVLKAFAAGGASSSSGAGQSTR